MSLASPATPDKIAGPPDPGGSPLLELVGVRKRFGDLQALDDVDLAVAGGEIVGLLGENGAGKSTLMNVLYGLVEPDAGVIRVRGQEVSIASPRAARALGIGMVHQHFTLVAEMTVLENLALEHGGRRLLWVDRKAIRQRIEQIENDLGWRVDPNALIDALSVGDRQRVEIIKALAAPSVRILVLDEPTASLAPGEVEELFAVLRRLRASGRAVVLISHKLREVLSVTDRVVVLRAGRRVAARSTSATDADELGALMIGSASRGTVARTGVMPKASSVRLRARGLVVGGRHLEQAAVRGVDLDVRAGEIVGIAGVDGNGQSELLEALIGLRRVRAGDIAVDGRDVGRPSPRRLRDLGVAYIPADRHRKAIAPDLTTAENLVLGHHRRPELGRGPLLDRDAMRSWALGRIAAFDVRPPVLSARVDEMSGGNQQRLVLAREVAFSPGVIVAESPTRGLDIAATSFVHDQLRAATDRGAAVLVASTDLEEVLELADRLLVMFEGRLRPCPSRERAVIGRMMGGVPDAAPQGGPVPAT